MRARKENLCAVGESGKNCFSKDTPARSQWCSRLRICRSETRARLRGSPRPFGGGMGRLREVCGAVSGMAMLHGLSRQWDTLDKEEKEELYAKERELAQKFREKAGASSAAIVAPPSPRGHAHSMKPYCRALWGLRRPLWKRAAVLRRRTDGEGNTRNAAKAAVMS